ncbi:LolA family protein [Streptomyces litchfieldiae]|uniref:Sigma-E factor regulatory protein RseB domain-containing protein n=1 Tax=Streptomyces litchfieldiae TaxID=3075543 RepID=A0ABU2MYK9_9ACTN|nr:sigma-E factor regulatory protein RseB domain-containing protein [Streptomyces sp. DSM 44938]MDT0346710.1 sigma-E factor regulatory protein RseB domain-containing protein [Streptomyces sp. DSM 44938]
MAKNSTIRRAIVPTAVVAGIAAAGAGLWPALASDGSPDLPEVTAEELLVRVAEADTAQLSGTVKVDADLGIPDLGGMLDGVLSGVGGPAGQLAGLVTGDSTLRVAMDGPDRQRLGLVDGSDEFTLIHNGDQLWAYDSASNTVYEAQVPEAEAGAEAEAPEWAGELTPQQAAERLLEAAGEHADISVDGTARVAGRSAYQLVVEPKDAAEAGISEARISVDGETGVPLAVTVDGPDGQVLDVAFSQIDFAQPAGGVFDFTPPSDAEVLEIDPNQPFGGGALTELLPDLAG